MPPLQRKDNMPMSQQSIMTIAPMVATLHYYRAKRFALSPCLSAFSWSRQSGMNRSMSRNALLGLKTCCEAVSSQPESTTFIVGHDHSSNSNDGVIIVFTKWASLTVKSQNYCCVGHLLTKAHLDEPESIHNGIQYIPQVYYSGIINHHQLS